MSTDGGSNGESSHANSPSLHLPPPPPPKLPPPPKKPIIKAAMEGVDMFEEMKKKQPEVAARKDLPEDVLFAPKFDLLTKVTCPRCEQLILESERESHANSHSSEIFPFLYLGGERNAHNKKELVVRTQVFFILNLAEEVENCFHSCRVGCECTGGGSDCNGRNKNNADSPLLFTYYTMKIKDLPGADIYPLFETVYKNIEEVKLAGGKVLVHCVAGISRSVSAVISYVMKSKGWTLKNSYEYVKQLRPIASPIEYFILQLQKYEAELGKAGVISEYKGVPTLLVSDVYPEGTRMITTNP